MQTIKTYTITPQDIKLYISEDNLEVIAHDTKHNVYHWVEVHGGYVAISGNYENSYYGALTTNELIDDIIHWYKVAADRWEFDMTNSYNQDEYKEQIKSFRLIGNNEKVPSEQDVITMTKEERIKFTEENLQEHIWSYLDSVRGLRPLYGTLYFYSDRHPVVIKQIVEDTLIALELKTDKEGNVLKNEITDKIYTLRWNDKLEKYVPVGSEHKRKSSSIGYTLKIEEPRYHYDLSF